MKLKATKMGSMKAVKDSLKKGGSNGGGITYIKNVPAEGITVRFLTEPEDWFGYYEYYDADNKSFVPMAEGEVLPDGAKPSFRYLTNAVDISSDRVVPLKLAKTAANALILKYDKWGTMMDRNYELQKHGEGLDTTYDVTPDAPTRLNLAKYDLLDLEDVLVAARAQATGETVDKSLPADLLDDDDDVEDTPAAPTKKTAAKKAKYTEDDLYPGGEYRTDYTEEELAAVDEYLGELGMLVQWWGYDTDELPDTEWIATVLAAQEAYNSDAAATDTDDSTDEDAEDASGDDDTDDTDDEDDDEEVVYDEDALHAMSIRELRLIANSLSIDVPKGTSKQDLVDLIIEAAEK